MNSLKIESKTKEASLSYRTIAQSLIEGKRDYDLMDDVVVKMELFTIDHMMDVMEIRELSETTFEIVVTHSSV